MKCDHCGENLVPTKFVSYYEDVYCYTCGCNHNLPYNKVVVGCYADCNIDEKDLDLIEEQNED
jgi:hypothetical protein